jgi:hypothetical protein
LHGWYDYIKLQFNFADRLKDFHRDRRCESYRATGDNVAISFLQFLSMEAKVVGFEDRAWMGVDGRGYGRGCGHFWFGGY